MSHFKLTMNSKHQCYLLNTLTSFIYSPITQNCHICHKIMTPSSLLPHMLNPFHLTFHPTCSLKIWWATSLLGPHLSSELYRWRVWGGSASKMGSFRNCLFKPLFPHFGLSRLKIPKQLAASSCSRTQFMCDHLPPLHVNVHFRSMSLIPSNQLLLIRYWFNS